MTRAKPDIWTRQADFKAQAAKAGPLANALTAAAETGGKKKIAAALGTLGEQGCTGCHRAFRAPRPKK